MVELHCLPERVVGGHILDLDGGGHAIYDNLLLDLTSRLTEENELDDLL